MRVLKELRNQLLDVLVAIDPMEVPKWSLDGTEIKSAKIAAAMMNIPLSEARLRMEVKDVYEGSGAQALPDSVGTVHGPSHIYERACRLAYKPMRRKKRRSNK